MSVRESVLRLHRWRLQERQDYLAGLESLQDRLRGDARRLQEEIGGYKHPVDQGGLYPLMMRPLVERHRRIEGSMREIEAQIGEARAAVDAAVQEVKHAEFGVASQADLGLLPRAVRRSRRERPNGHTNRSAIGERSRLF